MADEVIITRSDAVAYVTLNRPEVRNALDRAVIATLTSTFSDLARDENLRLVVLAGQGSVFCGGADIKYMRESLDWTAQENLDDALRLSVMFHAINACPVPVIAKIQG